MFFTAELLGKLFDHGYLLLVAVITSLWAHLKSLIRKAKEDSMQHANALVAVQSHRLDAGLAEIERQRDVSAKIFDKLEEMQRDAAYAREKAARENAERHERILTALHTGLAGKADK